MSKKPIRRMSYIYDSETFFEKGDCYWPDGLTTVSKPVAGSVIVRYVGSLGDVFYKLTADKSLHIVVTRNQYLLCSVQ